MPSNFFTEIYCPMLCRVLDLLNISCVCTELLWAQTQQTCYLQPAFPIEIAICLNLCLETSFRQTYKACSGKTKWMMLLINTSIRVYISFLFVHHNFTYFISHCAERQSWNASTNNIMCNCVKHNYSWSKAPIVDITGRNTLWKPEFLVLTWTFSYKAGLKLWLTRMRAFILRYY